MIDAVIFDFGGVIVDISGSGSVADIAVALGEEKDNFVKLHGPIVQKFAEGKLNEDEYWREVCQLTGKVRPDNWQDLWREKARTNTKLITEMVDLISWLKTKNVRCLILSNAIPPHEEVMREKGWYGFFDGLYFSYSTGFYKPDPRAYKNVLEKEKLNPWECVFVDDMEVNLRPAKELGIKTVLATEPQRTADLIRELVDLE